MSDIIRPIAQQGDESLSLISLPMDRPGFQEFLGSWLLQSPRETILVDCGVTGTYDSLKGALAELGAAPDLLLLTHVHLDHSGAAGCLSRDFLDMKVFCFEKAAKHLVNPEKLWNATAATLGEQMAAAYQPPLPIPAERIIGRDGLPAAWKVLDTPGHAAHHVSFLRDFAGLRICFGGEVLGVIAGQGCTSWFIDGVRRDGLRPATPPKYVPAVGAASMKLIASEPWDLFCAGHFGASRDRGLPERALDQIALWERKIALALECGLEESEIVTYMTLTDPELSDIKYYTPGDRERELYFLGNSVRGFIQYLSEQ